MLIRFENVNYTYSSMLAPARQALENVSFTLYQNEILAIAGESGSGKTTLIQHFNGLLKPDTGQIIYKNETEPNTKQIRSDIGLVFQFPERQLFEETVYKDVAFGLKNRGVADKNQIEKSVRDALEHVGLAYERFKDKSPFMLSGGEKRRVALAGILVMSPDILILDEPTVGLDGRGTELLVQIIQQYHSQGKTIVFVSHDMDLIARLANRLIVLKRGKIFFDGSLGDAFGNEKMLHKAGLELPGVTRFLKKLNAEGLSVRTDIWNVDEARRELAALKS